MKGENLKEIKDTDIIEMKIAKDYPNTLINHMKFKIDALN